MEYRARAEMADLHFFIATNSLSAPLGEREEPSRKREANDHSFCGDGQRPHKRHSMPLGDFALVPVPVHINTEA